MGNALRNNSGRKRSFLKKFRCALHGLRLGVRGEGNFKIHFGFGGAVIVAAAVLRMDDVRQWGLLLLCIAVVLSAELFNTALEHLARAISDRHDENLGAALDIGSAAVLAAALGAAAVGTVVFAHRLWELVRW